MKRFKNLAAFLMAAVMTFSVGMFVVGSDVFAEPVRPVFNSFTGRVESITPSYSDPERAVIRVTGEQGTADFVTDFLTFTLGDEVAAGDVITGYYEAVMPMIMIYPPRVNVRLIVNGEFDNVVIDRFDENLVSSNGMLQVVLGDDTEVVLQDGTPFNFEYGGIENRLLVVVYGPTTRGIPAMTLPGGAQKVVVMFERAVHLPGIIDMGGVELEPLPMFLSFTGQVVEVNETQIRVEGEDGTAVFMADDNTYFLGGTPVIGDVITGWYEARMPMIMIYPPHYNTRLIVNGEFNNVHIERFDENLVSSDGMLQLNITENTEIIVQGAEPDTRFEGSLANRLLAVVYDVATFSMPAMTAPNKVVVLIERGGVPPETTEPEPLPMFLPFTGKVTEIMNVTPIAGAEPFVHAKSIRVEGEDGTAVFFADGYTYFLGDAPQVGDVITGYFESGLPMILIYPPQFSVRLIVNGEFNNVHIDRFTNFENRLISYDGWLELNITEDTEVILQDGTPFNFEYGGLHTRLLVVVYDVSTRSVPAITIPNKVVVMFEQAVPLPGDGGFEPPIQAPEVPGFLPVRAEMEARGVTVEWNNGVVTLTDPTRTVTFTIGGYEYTLNGETITLQTPSTLINDRTYVPVEFFTEVWN